MYLAEIGWLEIVLPIVCLVGLGLLQFAFFFAFCGWQLPSLVGIQVAMVAFLFGFGFWTGAMFTATEKVFLFASLYAVVMTAIALPISLRISKKISSFSGYYYYVASTDVQLVATLIFASVKRSQNVPSATLMTEASIILPFLFFGVILAIAYLLPPAFVKAKQTFPNMVDRLPNGNGKKIKVVLLGGQSNASGSTRVVFLKKNCPEKFARFEKGFNNVWIDFFDDNGTLQSKGFTRAKVGQGSRKGFFGPELGLSEVLSEARKDNTYIIKYAWGGTNLHTQWLSPSSAEEEGKEVGKLYTAFISFVRRSLSYLKKKGYDPEVVAFCWMQGAGDSCHPYCDSYKTHIAHLIDDVNGDLASYHSGGKITLIDAAITDCKLPNGKPVWTEYEIINQAKRENALEKGGVFLDTVAEKLSCYLEPTGEFHTPKKIDYAHYDSLASLKLGNLFGEAVVRNITEKE